MKVLTAGEVAEWFQGFKNLADEHAYVHCDDRGPFFTHPEGTCIDLEYPQKLERLSFFAHCVATIGYEDRDFQGALIWFTQWGVWNLSDERVGYRIVERMSSAAGQPQSFEAAPGYWFRGRQHTNRSSLATSPEFGLFYRAGLRDNTAFAKRRLSLTVKWKGNLTCASR